MIHKEFTVMEMDNQGGVGNAFNWDAFHMGIQVGKVGEHRLMLMVPNHQDEQASYMYLVNEASGERLKIIVNDKPLNECPF
jgi:hypothetical protein